MRRPATSIALILAVLSGFVLAQIWSLAPAGSRSIQAVPSGQVEATTLAFYQAMNGYFERGDDATLRRLLHPGFVTRQPGGSATGGVEDFFQYLDSIRRFFPGIQLTAEVTTLSPNAASVAVSWDAREQRDFAGIAIDPIDLIGRLDLVRIERGLIVEHRSSVALAGRLDAFPPLSIDLPGSLNTLVARVRQIPLHGDYEPTGNSFRQLLLVNLSSKAFLEVMLQASTPAVIWKQQRNRAADPVPVEPESVVALDRMEAVFLPVGTRFRMWDAGDQDATLIALEFGPPVSSETRPESPLFADLRTTLWSGIELKGVGDRLTLSFGRADLLPGAVLSNPEVEGLELSWVTSGALEIAGSRGEMRTRAASGLRSQLIERHAELRAGDAGAAGPGADATYRAIGDESSTVWFFSLAATPGQSDADEPDTPTAPTPLPTPPPIRNVS